MRLVNIEDLRRPQEHIEPLIKQAQGLADLYDAFLKQDDETYSYEVVDYAEDTRAAGIHASEMSKCRRRLVYGILGTERRPDVEKVNANMKLRFRTGTAIHAMLQSDFTRMAAWYTTTYQAQGYSLTFEKELSVKPDKQALAYKWGIHSSCDGCFTFWRWDPTAGSWLPYLRVGVEVKTSSAGMYEKRTKPEPDHAEQTCLYQACLDLPLMWVFYYNKSNSNYTTPNAPWLFKFDSNLWERELEARFSQAHQEARSGQLPERAPGIHCDWCPFRYTCQPPNRRRRGTPLVPGSMRAQRP